jgi:DNA-directed RNA polymerase subunit M/transcription elongation factor TFIIS
MGNKGSRTIQPTEIKANRNPILTNVIEVKQAEIKPDNSKCQSCHKSGKDFTVVSRDGTTFTKMYYCRTCSLHWKE